MTTIVVVAGGPAPVGTQMHRLPTNPAAVLAADSGLDHARTLGLIPTMVVGDMDSVSAMGLAWARHEKIPMQEFSANKDQTDLELALDIACRSADQVVVVDGGAGRLDHGLANLMLLASERYRGVRITALVGASVVTVVWEQRELTGAVGSLVSLVPVGGPAGGVCTTGMQWPLDDAQLLPGSTWGISNVLTDVTATVAVSSGAVLAVQPEPDGSP